MTIPRLATTTLAAALALAAVPATWADGDGPRRPGLLRRLDGQNETLTGIVERAERPLEVLATLVRGR